jgi:hypothetical protein
MDDRRTLYELMTELGVGRAVTDVYGVVLTCGPLSRRAILDILGSVPAPIDEVLSFLEGQGLIGSVYRRLRRRQFYAASPDIAWPAVSATLLWSETDALSAGTALEATRPAVEAQRRLCGEIAAVAGRLRRPHDAAGAHEEWDAATTDEFAHLVCEGIARARREVVAVSTSPHLPHVASFWTTLTGRLATSVTYRRVVDLDEIVGHGLAFVRRDMDEYGIDVKVLARDRIQHKFYVVDRSLLAVFHDPAAPARESRTGVGRITRRRAIVRRYARRFEQYAEAAVPARTVLDGLERASSLLLRTAEAGLTAEELAWVESLVRFGKFSRFHVTRGWSDADLRRAEERARGIGVVRRSAEGDIVPAYPVTEEDLLTPRPPDSP